MQSTQNVTLFIFPFVPWDPEYLLKASGIIHTLNHFELLKLLKCAWISNTLLSVNISGMSCQFSFNFIWVQSMFYHVVGNPGLGILEVCCPSLEFDRVSRIWLSAQTSPASPSSTLPTTEMPVLSTHVVPQGCCIYVSLGAQESLAGSRALVPPIQSF